jgi:surface antigen
VKPKQCPNAVTPVNIKVVKTKKKNGTRCKTYQTEVIIDGELKTEKETACKGKNGNWSAINT